MSAASLDQWYASVNAAIRDREIEAVPGLLFAMAVDGYGHEAESLRRFIVKATSA